MLIKNNSLHLLRFFLSYLAIVGLCQFIIFTILDLSTDAQLSIYQFCLVSLSNLAGTAAVIAYFILKVDKKTFTDFWGITFNCKQALLGFFSGLIIMGIGFLILLFTKQLVIQSIRFRLLPFFISIIAFLAVATAEELLVRGYILNKLLTFQTNGTSIIISAIIFMALHSFNPHLNILSFINLFLSGILLGIGYMHTRNLSLPVALHFSWNFFQGTIFGFNVSGLHFYSIMSQKTPSANFWNGGLFGFESSIICMLFQIGAIVAYQVFFEKQRASMPIAK